MVHVEQVSPDQVPVHPSRVVHSFSIFRKQDISDNNNRLYHKYNPLALEARHTAGNAMSQLV